MSGVKIVFHRAIVNSQEYGSNSEYMVSRIFFTIINYTKRYKDLFVDLKQTVGSNYETDPLEIGIPQGFKKPINYSAFRDAVETYYRALMGRNGKAIHTDGNTMVFLNGVVFEMEMVAEIKVENPNNSW